MQTKKQATVKKAPAKTAKPAVKKAPAKTTKPSYTVINVRVMPDTKAAMARIAKKRKKSLSKAVEDLIIEQVILDHISGDDVPQAPWPVGLDPSPLKSARDPMDTITITGQGPSVYQSPAWRSKGRPVDPKQGNWFMRVLHRLFG